MEQTSALALVIAAVIGLIATLVLLRHQREAATESPFAVSTEGEKRCPKCGMGNLWTDATCIACHAKLPG
jgi:hypothetical protein